MIDPAAATSVPRHRLRSWVLILLIGVIAATGGVAAYTTDLWPRLENDTLAMRFQLRPASTPDDIVVVAVDDITFSENENQQWPFPRSDHADVIDQLREAGAAQIVYDVQFTEESDPEEDYALYEALGRARNVVLATTETEKVSLQRRRYIEGITKVFGGESNLRPVHAEAAAANLPTDEGGAIQRFDWSYGGLQTIATVAARRATARPLDQEPFGSKGAWIDFRGPPGTIRTLSFSRVQAGPKYVKGTRTLRAGSFDPASVKGKVVVVGADHETLQDTHSTPTAGHELMSGPEIQANAIWTALHGMPLRSLPIWLEMLIIVGVALFPFVAGLRLRPLAALLLSISVGVGFCVAGYFAFTSGIVLTVTYPLAALILGTVGMVVVSYVSERYERRVMASINEVLEDRVAERTEEVRATQLELISRLGRAAERRDTDTGEHIERMSHLCARVAQAMGMSVEESEVLQHAAAMHDIGKIGIPDRVLLKEGALNAEEWEVMRSHTVIGADVLANSPSPLLQMAETIARTHHERWDGTGYPAGLAGEDIPLVGRICAIGDAFDALTSRRPYKEPWPIADALQELRAQRGRHFDPAVVDAFFALGPLPEPADVPVPRVPAHDPDPARV